eukprot:6479636-Amphidinium_carterae.1
MRTQVRPKLQWGTRSNLTPKLFPPALAEPQVTTEPSPQYRCLGALRIARTMCVCVWVCKPLKAAKAVLVEDTVCTLQDRCSFTKSMSPPDSCHVAISTM